MTPLSKLVLLIRLQNGVDPQQGHMWKEANLPFFSNHYTAFRGLGSNFDYIYTFLSFFCHQYDTQEFSAVSVT